MIGYFLLLLLLCFATVGAAAATEIDGLVHDALGRPIGGASIEISSGAMNQVSRSGKTDSQGRFRLEAPVTGKVNIAVRRAGFGPAEKSVHLSNQRGGNTVEITLQAERALTMPLTATRQRQYRNMLSSEGANAYRFNQTAIHELPAGSNTKLSQILNQAPGVSQDGYGQGQGDIHIHGENGGGIQYRLNGIFLPDALSEFGEIFSARFARSISLLTGVLPADIGYKTEGVVDIRTKSGCIDNRSLINNVEVWGGQRDTIQPSFEYGGCKGSVGYYFSGFYLQSLVGLQSPTTSGTPRHDRTRQGQLFGAVTLTLAPTARLTLLTGIAENYFQIPPTPGLPPGYELDHVENYPSSDVNESEQEQNYYEIATLNGTLAGSLDYQIALFDRYYQLNYAPDPIGDLIYNGIAPHLTHRGWLNGAQADVTERLAHGHLAGVGFYASGESIAVNNHALTFPAVDGDQTSNSPIMIIDNHRQVAWLGGIYLEDQWRAAEGLMIFGGVRWDVMSASVNENQFSPRFSIVYELTSSTLIHCGYARYFKTPPFDAVTFGTIAAFRHTTATAGTPYGSYKIAAERDDYITVGIRHKLRDLNVGIDGFDQQAHDELDLAQLGGTPLQSPISYRKARAWGADLTLDYHVADLSGYLNFSYAVLQARDMVAGQFLADSAREVAYVASHWILLDDSQEFTASGGLAYLKSGFLFSLDGFWGSGYRRGFANTGKLPPILQFNCAVERSFKASTLGQVAVRLTLINIFDHVYQIRNGTGIGVSSPQYGPRRSLYGSIRIPLPF